MATADMPPETKGSPSEETIEPHWVELDNAYVCSVFLCPEAEGGLSGYAPELPGVVSQGETEEEALAHIKEALLGAILTYLEEDGSIPWCRERIEKPAEAKERRILVNV